MKLVETAITLAELIEMSNRMFGKLVKAVVDIEKEVIVVDASLHADQEELLLECGSLQENLWGINLHPEKFGNESWIEFDSMINMRPSQGNCSRGIDNVHVQKKIRNIVNKLVQA